MLRLQFLSSTMELLRSHSASLRVIGVGLLLVGLRLLLYLLPLTEALFLKLVEDGTRNKIARSDLGWLTCNHGHTFR